VYTNPNTWKDKVLCCCVLSISCKGVKYYFVAVSYHESVIVRHLASGVWSLRDWAGRIRGI